MRPSSVCLRLDTSHSGTLSPHDLQDLVEYVAMVFVEKLRDQRKIFALSRQMFGKAGILDSARGADMEIGHVPILDEVAKRARRLETLELA